MSFRGNRGGGTSRGFSSFSFGPRGGGRKPMGSHRGGLTSSTNAVPPPPSIMNPDFNQTSKQGYLTMHAISQNAINTTYGLPTTRQKTEEE
jgi:hypothetical protein